MGGADAKKTWPRASLRRTRGGSGAARLSRGRADCQRRRVRDSRASGAECMGMPQGCWGRVAVGTSVGVCGGGMGMRMAVGLGWACRHYGHRRAGTMGIDDSYRHT